MKMKLIPALLASTLLLATPFLAQAQAAALGEQISLRDFYHIAGHRNSASYGLQKLMWVRDNEPEVYAKTYKALNAKDFIVLRLTGKF